MGALALLISGCGSELVCSNAAGSNFRVSVAEDCCDKPICNATVSIGNGETDEVVPAACFDADAASCTDALCRSMHLPAGDYSLVVEAPGYATVTTGVHVPVRAPENDCASVDKVVKLKRL